MKTANQQLFLTAACLLLVATAHTEAQIVYLDHQHMDLQLQYDPAAEGTNRLDVVLTYDPGQRATNDQAYIVGGTHAQLTIPGNPNFAFLGTPGAPIWVLPQSQNATLPNLGTSGEEIPFGVFDGPLDLELISVKGPGNFFTWANSGGGQPPLVKYICTNGVVSTEHNVVHLHSGCQHWNWGFSSNGLYHVTFRAAGQRIGESTNIVGKEVTWAFQILPLRPWEEWISTNWPPATASSTIGPAADPDGDGVPNALEYALGLNPHIASTTGLPKCQLVERNGETYGALTFTRVKSAMDIDYLPSARSELSSGDWTPLTNVITVIDHGETETVTVRDSEPQATNPTCFYQLRARLNYP